METYRRTLARNLRRIVKEKGYRTLELFAHENGFQKSMIAKIARGAQDLKVSTFIRIAKALEVELSEFYPIKKRKR